MSNRPARISQAEIERANRAARKAGATEVEVKMGDGVFDPDTPNPRSACCGRRGDCPLMDSMPRPRPPHLQRQVTRHGKAAWYVRVGKGPRVRIRSAFGTPDFYASIRPQ